MRVVTVDKENLHLAQQISAVAFYGKTQAHVSDAAREQAYAELQKTAWGRTYLALDDDGSAVSTLSCNDYTVQFDGGSLKMSGVGNVATYPHKRNRGGVRECFRAAFAQMREQGQAVSVLHPFSDRYYAQFGYACVSPVLRYVIPTRNLPAMGGGTYTLYTADAGLAELAGVWNAYARRYNLLSRRGEEEFARYTQFDPYAADRHLYLYYGADGTPKAYAALRKVETPNGPTLELPREDFAFADAEGLCGILALAGKFQATYETLTLELPQSFPLELYLPETVLGHPHTQRYFCGMARVVDVEAVLRAAKYRGTGSAVLQISDPYLPENDGCFQVEFADAVCQNVARVETTPDIQLSINDFTALIFGMYSLDTYLFRGVQANNIPALGQIFYAKPCYVREFF